MKYFLIPMLCLILVSCGTVGDYYVVEGSGENRSHTTLHKDEHILVHLDHFDRNISTLTIYQQNTDEVLAFKIVKVAQSLLANNAPIASSFRDDTKRILSVNPESSVLLKITEVYELDSPLERVTEKVTLELLVNEKSLNITKEFPLKRVTYNHLQALMGI